MRGKFTTMAKKNEAKTPQGVQNRKARFDFEIIDQYEAGIALIGCEVKSVYLGRANLTDAHCEVRGGEIWLVNADIEPYAYATHYKPERRRERKLLMHRREIEVLDRKSKEKGLALIVLSMYFKSGRVKVEVALGRGKRQYDKREQIQKNETRREVDRALKSINR